jgi:hypothetical protein
MEIFGIASEELIFSIFLPFLFFYLLVYALLRKSMILGKPEEANTLNIFLALTISALGTFSIYYFGLSTWLPFLAGFTAVAAFIILYLYGIFGRAKEKLPSYISGEAFKTEDEKKFDAGVRNCQGLWENFEKEQKPENRENLAKQLVSEINNLDPLAKKLGKSLYEYEWYRMLRKGGETRG